MKQGQNRRKAVTQSHGSKASKGNDRRVADAVHLPFMSIISGQKTRRFFV